ncbi:hypothetical protein BOTCAL_0521g00050 [Botryotinia calthae]|uniref:Uncharacterized protein n=1 Tax=Botryotinia calthae TaxID=38488 RepID=A0A4Y8CLH9_9HELO|nr:hypothetical protein BOTCAL_0521g00050 [Botryotinia calthae]
MSVRKRAFRQGAPYELNHTNSSLRGDLQPCCGPSRLSHPSQVCLPQLIGSCFELPNPGGSYTYFRDCSEPEVSSHPGNIYAARSIRSCIRKKNQNGLYNHHKACDEESVIDDDTPRTHIPMAIPNGARDEIDERLSQNQIQDDVHFLLPICTDQCRKDHHIIQNDEGGNVPPSPSCSSSNNPNYLPPNVFNNSSNDETDLVTEIHRLHERIDLLENNILGHVEMTAYCRCSCYRSSQSMTLPPDNSWHESEPQLFPDPRNDWDESGEPGFSTPVVQEQSTRGVKNSLREILSGLGKLSPNEIRDLQALLERNVGLRPPQGN